jgi:diguanylate cyclase (GGDEF)-like protein
MFDIDHFKIFNDHYGHLAGDEALHQIAECMGRVVRASENVYRYGGEEFLLIMTDCNADSGLVAAKRVCQAVHDMAIPHESRPTPPPVVTLSGGVASWTRSSPLTALEVLSQSDAALYVAKAAGRNCVHVAAAHDTREAEGAPPGT